MLRNFLKFQAFKRNLNCEFKGEFHSFIKKDYKLIKNIESNHLKGNRSSKSKSIFASGNLLEIKTFG